MNFLENLAAQRQKLLDGIDANEGDINLRIFEDFYPDEAHFIYELLQNAEDAGATEVAFELTDQACYVEHNGSRQFNERDIRSITGIFNSSKKDNADKIGKFGVGFKSVYVYTETPIVYSKDFSFKILKLVLPQAIVPKPGLGTRTRFEFPFNSPKKDAKAAFSEVESGLKQLADTTLLFLNNLRYISWSIGDQAGAVRRELHPDAHIEILKLADGDEVSSSHWLRFSAPIERIEQLSKAAGGVERQEVAVAFEMAFRGELKSFDPSKPIADQLRIVPAIKGKVSVYFPAEKETSGLRFHLHAPFIPELSRASIKNSPENTPLFEQLAVVSARALHAIKELGLLAGDFLAVLPNNDDSLSDRYKGIRQAIISEMKSQPLVPTVSGDFAPASRLLQSRAPIKVLLSDDDIAFVANRSDQPTWVIGATQRNQNQDKFLTSLGIPTWDAEDLKRFFETKARKSVGLWDKCELSPGVLSWLAGKSFEWLQALYALLYRHCEGPDGYGKLQTAYFIRLVSGSWGTGDIAYFQTGPASATDPLHRVDDRILTDGTKKTQQQDARLFLERIGVREPNELDELEILLRSRYGETSAPPDDKVYVADLRRMIALLESDPSQKGIFSKARIFRVASLSLQWVSAAQVYLDEPFVRTGLKVLYDLTVDQSHKRWPLDSWYLSCGILAEKISSFAEKVGCQKEFDKLYTVASCAENPKWGDLALAAGSRAGNVINRDFAITGEALLLLKANQVGAGLLVWKAICRSETVRPTVLKACFQWTEKGGPRYSDSQLVCSLKELAWVPQTDGTFVKPSAANASRLPKGFALDAGYKWLGAVGFGTDDAKRDGDNAVRAARRAELGFKSEEELQRAQAFTKLSEQDQQRVLDFAANTAEDSVELPERPVRNPELRHRRVGDEAKKAPEKSSVQRQRSVQLGYAEEKAAAKVYLMDQYTNSSGQMICQACKNELPFKLLTGVYYFEAVELFADAPKRYRETFLALCPNHAAAFQYANAQQNSMPELVAAASGTEIAVALGGMETTLYFTQMHLADVKACLESEDDADA